MEQDRVIVKLPFCSFGGYFFLNITVSDWEKFCELYQDESNYEMEDDEGELLVIDLSLCITGAEVMQPQSEEMRSFLTSMHDDRMHEILCCEGIEEGWSMKWALTSNDLFSMIMAYDATETEAFTRCIGSNYLTSYIYGELLQIEQSFDVEDDAVGEVRYTISLANQMVVATQENLITVVDGFLKRMVPDLQKQDIEDDVTFFDIAEATPVPRNLTPGMMKHLSKNNKK